MKALGTPNITPELKQKVIGELCAKLAGAHFPHHEPG